MRTHMVMTSNYNQQERSEDQQVFHDYKEYGGTY